MRNNCQRLSDRQVDILKHALGVRNGGKQYRNHFVTGEGSDDFADCEALVTRGLMERQVREWVTGYIYTVTLTGRALVRNRPSFGMEEDSGENLL